MLLGLSVRSDDARVGVVQAERLDLEAVAQVAQRLPLPEEARKQLARLEPRGTVHVDAGAARALFSGKSLLPAGLVAVSGRFGRGDTVSVQHEGAEIARGLVAYGADEARLIAGRRSSQIEALLGYVGRDEIIHRDDLVMTTKQERT